LIGVEKKIPWYDYVAERDFYVGMVCHMILFQKMIFANQITMGTVLNNFKNVFKIF